MCRIWMDTVAGKEMKEGIRLLSIIGMVLIAMRIVLMVVVAIAYHSAYAGFILIDIFALLACILIYLNIIHERNAWILLGVALLIVDIIYLFFFCLIAVVWMVLYKIELNNFLVSLLLTSLSMFLLVFLIYYVMAVLSDYNKRMLEKYCSKQENNDCHSRDSRECYISDNSRDCYISDNSHDCHISDCHETGPEYCTE